MINNYRKFITAFLCYVAVLVIPVLLIKIVSLVLLIYPEVNRAVAGIFIAR